MRKLIPFIGAIALLTGTAAFANQGGHNSKAELKADMKMCEDPALHWQERMNCRSQMSALMTASERATVVEAYQKMIDERTQPEQRPG